MTFKPSRHQPADHPSLAVIRDQLHEAIGAAKCHGCGCLQQTVAALAATDVGRNGLAPLLAEARGVFTEKRYDCLGCAVCYPAIAANAFAEIDPAAAGGMDLCPTAPPDERVGWPPLPGDFHVVRYRASVAVCTLNSADLAKRLAKRAPEGLAIVGTLHTENLGIERLIRNIVANPHIRYLVLCGEDTRQAIGHLPGQSLVSLFEHGLGDGGRIAGARGKRPVIKNASAEEVEHFRRQVTLVARIGEEREDVIVAAVASCDPAARPFEGVIGLSSVPVVSATEPRLLITDPTGFFVVYPDSARKRLVIEHYTNDGALGCVVEGATPAALYSEVIARGLVSRLEHAAYLGRELARAQHCLETGERYVQDRAPGELATDEVTAGCGCATSCGEKP